MKFDWDEYLGEHLSRSSSEVPRSAVRAAIDRNHLAVYELKLGALSIERLNNKDDIAYRPAGREMMPREGVEDLDRGDEAIVRFP